MIPIQQRFRSSRNTITINSSTCASQAPVCLTLSIVICLPIFVDGEAVYFVSNTVALRESLIKDAELKGQKYINTVDDMIAASRGNHGVLRKLFLKTGNVSTIVS